MDKVLFIDEMTRGFLPSKTKAEINQEVAKTLGLTLENSASA